MQRNMNTKKMRIFAAQGEAAYSSIATGQGNKGYPTLRAMKVSNAAMNITATQTKTAR
jgi:hypothetical protein